jgi:plasmid stability protein
MSKMIQIRNVPDDVHATLKARAASAGLSLSDFLLQLATREVTRPTIEELTERIRARGGVDLGEEAATIIRRGRDAYDGD